MKKLLFTLLISIFFIPYVSADELSNPLDCFEVAPSSSTLNMFRNKWKQNDNRWCGFTNNMFWDYTSDSNTSSAYLCTNFIVVEPDMSYTFTHFTSSLSATSSNRNNYYYIFDENFNRVASNQTFFNPPFTFTTPSNAKYFTYCTYANKSYVNSNYSSMLMMLEKGTTITGYVEFQEKEEEPEPEPIVPDTTLDSFYTLFIEKLSSLGQYAIENKFLLGALSIILLFVVLELILNLFRKGGYH